MAVEQRHIAEALKLSKATVSRSLRNDPMISAATRARVYEQAIRMGYRPRERVLDVSLSPQLRQTLLVKPGNDGLSTGLIHLGVLSHGTLSPGLFGSVVALRLLHGMSGSARANQATLHTEYLNEQECGTLDDPEQWPPILRQGVVSGLVLLHPFRQAVVEALARRFPCAHFLWPEGDTPVECVTDDSFRSMRQLIGHLHGLGHRRIGFADSGVITASDRARLASYIMSLDELGLQYDPIDARFVTGQPTFEDRIEQVAAHVQRRASDGVRAWVCMNDFWGYKLIESLNARGVRVPEDVSVCGFDNFDPPPGLPKLTSIEGPFEKIGATAVDRVIKRITDPNAEPVHVMLGCRLIVGRSTGRV